MRRAGEGGPGGSDLALVRPRRRRRLLRPGARQPGPAARHRRALPPRAGVPGRAGARDASCPAPPSRCSSATSSTPGRPCGSPGAPGGPTSRALPFGINTVSLFAFVFLVMLPAKLAAQAAGAADPARVAWQAGLVACLGSGLIELAGRARGRADPAGHAPRRAPLHAGGHRARASSRSASCCAPSRARSWASPRWAWCSSPTSAGSASAAACPGGLVAVAARHLPRLGHRHRPGGPAPGHGGGLVASRCRSLGALWEALSGGHLATYLSVILPMGLFTLVGSLQNVESAEAAGDAYPTLPSLTVNGVSTVAAACLGSCFPTTLYIGHPGWKALGARAGYSVLNGVFVDRRGAHRDALLDRLGGAHRRRARHRGLDRHRHLGAGLPGGAAGARARGGDGAPARASPPGACSWPSPGCAPRAWAPPGGRPSPTAWWTPSSGRTSGSRGGFALEQGFIFTAMILSAGTVMIIERRFRAAAGWFADGRGALGDGARALLAAHAAGRGDGAAARLAVRGGVRVRGGAAARGAVDHRAGRGRARVLRAPEGRAVSDRRPARRSSPRARSPGPGGGAGWAGRPAARSRCARRAGR